MAKLSIAGDVVDVERTLLDAAEVGFILQCPASDIVALERQGRLRNVSHGEMRRFDAEEIARLVVRLVAAGKLPERAIVALKELLRGAPAPRSQRQRDRPPRYDA